MKALKISELDSIVEHMQWAVGARVQKVFVSERDICLQLYKDREIRSLHIDMNPKVPFVFINSWPPVQPSKKTTPALLFLRSHFIGKTIESVWRDNKLGRVLKIQFISDSVDALNMEIRLLPHGPNLLLKSGEKSISVFKPKELKELTTPSNEMDPDPRSIKELEREWRLSRQVSGEGSPQSEKKVSSQQQRLLKLQKSIAQVEDNLKVQTQSTWERAGQVLLEKQSVAEAHQIFPDLVDRELSLAENIERCFAQHKKSQSKIAGSRERLEELKRELLRVESLSDEEWNHEVLKSSSTRQTRPRKPDQKSDVRTRKTMVEDRFEVLVGKSAKDNLGLLRKARAWDLWMHLKDHPGAHAILFRNKNEVVSDQALIQAAQFLVQVSSGKGLGLKEGDIFAVMIAEVRHVNPIKGDQIGRVTVRESRTLSVRYHSKNATRN